MSSSHFNDISILDVFNFQQPMEPQTGSKKISTFIIKLWNIVNDPKLTHIVGWEKTGLSFFIKQPYVMYKKVLPLYFRHSNLNSFIRQLNMYGFRKNTDVEGQGLSNVNSMETFHFYHQHFIRGRYDLLDNIKRKTPNPKVTPGISTGTENQYNFPESSLLLDEIKSLKTKLVFTENITKQLTLQYDAFRKEVDALNARFKMQQNVINSLYGVISKFEDQQPNSKMVNSPNIYTINRDMIKLKDNIHLNYTPSNVDSSYVDLEFLNRTINNNSAKKQ
uniref:HSF_DOMAIN domain-containing protein n=1 Tax=Strongyloides venezuelensis TaxID=75913 RepID=A0A0K0FQ75_STRVS